MTDAYTFQAEPILRPIYRPIPPATAQAFDKMRDAFEEYGRHDGDWLCAREYRDAGYALGDEMVRVPVADRENWLDLRADEYPDSAQCLIWSAAKARVAELEAGQ